jgi:hypothetical protein
MLKNTLIRSGIIIAWLAAIGVAPAQETGRAWGFVSPNADLTAKPEAAPPLDLRANVTIPLYLYVVNPTEDTPTVAAHIRSGGSAIATVARVTLLPNTLTKFAVSPEAPPAGKAAAPADGVPVVADAKTNRLTFHVSVSNLNKPNEAANESNQVVNFVNPSSFLGETTAVMAGTGNQLTVSVKANNLKGPPCHVELVLSPDEIPGLQVGELKGVLRGTLTAEQPNATLIAGGLMLAPGTSGQGRLSLTVDGIERAIVMKGSFKPQAGATSDPFKLEAKRDLHVLAPKFAKPGDDVTAKFEAINVADNSQVTFTVSPGSTVAVSPVQTQTRTGPRDQRTSAKVADDGSLGVTTVVKDWAFRFETRGLYGPVTLKASTAAAGEVKDASTVVVFDDTPPKNVAFLPGDPMKPPVRGRKYIIRTTGEDKDSDITKVEYFVGVEPPVAGADGKMPAEPKPVMATVDPKSPMEAPAWMANINLPEKKGVVPVFARFTNGVGLTTTAKLELDVLDPPNGSVKGQVLYGDKPQNKDVTVWLMSKDLKTIVKDTKVNAEAKFEIKDVPAGEYILATEQKTSAKPLQGAASVTIKEGPEVTVQDLTLKKK